MDVKVNVFKTDGFWSAVKRKQVMEMLDLMFTYMGEDEAAAIAKGTTRVTDLSIKRIRESLSGAEETTEEDVTTEDEQETTCEKEEPVSGSIDEHKAIVKAIKKGKGKKALKLIKAARHGGAKGSALKDLEKQANALLK